MDKEQAASTPRIKLWLPNRKVIVVLIFLIFLVGTAFYYRENHKTPLSGSIKRKASFVLYYPSQLPRGFSYQKGSAKVDAGLVLYTLKNGDKEINVTEQTKPVNNLPDLDNLIGFNKLEAPAGKAAIGTTDDKVLAFILSNTTLISIAGSKNVPNDIISATAKNMASL